MLFASTAAWAQVGSTAQITGTVRDDSGAVLPGVDVTVTQTATGFMRTAVTDAAGGYALPNLPIGPYRLQASLSGFKTFQQTGIVLQVGSSPTINVTLGLGQLSETVTVQGEAPLIETRNMGVGQVMDNKRIVELPLNGRNAAELLQYLPAAVPVPALNASTRSFGGTQGGLAFSIAGGASYGVSYVLDGAMHNNPYDNLNLPLPFPDALQEFRVESSALTAQNGMHSGGAVNAVTKSGTNQLHGDAFEFLRDHNFNATNPFNAKDANGNRKDDGLKRNQFGGTLGGPIVANKLFFFGGYQGTRTNQQPSDNRAFVPTQAMLNGDFSAFASPACNNGRPLALRAPFVNNQVSPSRFSPAALAISSKLPTTTDPCGLVQYAVPSEVNEYQAIGKVDYTINDKQTVFGRYMATSLFQDPPFNSSNGNVLATGVGGHENLAQAFTAGHNFVLSPTTLNSLRVAFNRTAIHRTNGTFFDTADVGIQMYDYMKDYMLLSVAPGGFAIGNGVQNEAMFTTNTYQFSDDVTLIKGAHQFAVGANWAHWNSTSSANVRSPGQLTINGSVTGAALADFLLGNLTQLQQSAPNFLLMKQTYTGFYGQDTWRASSRVTVNYGVRWEPFFPQQITNGAIYNFDYNRFVAGTKSTVFKNAPAGLYFPGDPGFPTKAGTHIQWGNVGPRVGVAWDPSGSGKTSVRASYGRSYDFVNAQFHLNTSNAPPWGDEIRVNNPAGGLDRPFVGADQPNIFPTQAASPDVPFTLFGPYLSLNYDMKTPSVDLWNVTVERQIAPSLMVSAGYIGSHTQHILESTPLNNGDPTVTSAVVNGARVTCVPGSAAFQTCMNNILNQRRPFYLANPAVGQFYGPTDAYVQDGKQHYNGMLLSITRRGTRTTLNANYTLSRCFGSPDGSGGGTANLGTGYNDPNNHAFDDGPCSADRRHVFVLTAGVQSPDRWGVIGSGWRLVGTFRALSAPPLTVTPGSDRALNGQTATQRVDQVSDDVYADKSINPQNGGMRFLNPNAFALPALGTLGNMAPNSIRGIGTRRLDLSLTRVFRLWNAHAFEVRADAFNALNWFQWNQPATNLGNLATFGQITNADDPRIMQFAIKYTF